MGQKEKGVEAGIRKGEGVKAGHRHGMNYREIFPAVGSGRSGSGRLIRLAGRKLAFEVQAGKEMTRLAHDVQID